VIVATVNYFVYVYAFFPTNLIV